MNTCLFCLIARKEIPADVVYEDDEVVAFRDIHPKYRVHVLVIPKSHIASAAAIGPEQDALMGKVLRVGGELAAAQGLLESGFRLLTNTGPDAGQVVPHVHLHLIGGEPLRPV
jgi:histidine triad (HIT) family protein